MKTGMLITVLSLGMMAPSVAMAQERPAGEKLYKRVCKTCHGPTAKGMASFPRLAGHTSEYLAERLELYRAGEKVGPNTPLMRPHAKKLSDDDIADLSTYIATTLSE